MSTAHAEHHAPDHVPHVTPLDVYLKTYGGLLFLTVITVGASRVDLGTTINLIVAMLIATVKATVVAAFFMHLIADHAFHTAIFLSSIVFLFIFVAFTMFDTAARGRADKLEGVRPVDVTDPFKAPTGLTPATSAAPAATTKP